MKQFKQILDSCYKLMLSRNKKYGNSWQVLSIPTIANLIEAKMNRISKLGLDAKIEDEFIDAINYSVFGLIKLYESKHKKNET